MPHAVRPVATHDNVRRYEKVLHKELREVTLRAEAELLGQCSNRLVSFAQHSYCRTDPSRVDHMERRCTDAFFETPIKMRARKTDFPCHFAEVDVWSFAVSYDF